jgi:hypothetical protein
VKLRNLSDASNRFSGSEIARGFVLLADSIFCAGSGRASLDWTAEGGCPYKCLRSIQANNEFLAIQSEAEIIQPSTVIRKAWGTLAN